MARAFGQLRCGLLNRHTYEDFGVGRLPEQWQQLHVRRGDAGRKAQVVEPAPSRTAPAGGAVGHGCSQAWRNFRHLPLAPGRMEAPASPRAGSGMARPLAQLHCA